MFLFLSSKLDVWKIQRKIQNETKNASNQEELAKLQNTNTPQEVCEISP